MTMESRKDKFHSSDGSTRKFRRLSVSAAICFAALGVFTWSVYSPQAELEPSASTSMVGLNGVG